MDVRIIKNFEKLFDSVAPTGAGTLLDNLSIRLRLIVNLSIKLRLIVNLIKFLRIFMYLHAFNAIWTLDTLSFIPHRTA